jgi:hypothetical protein
MMNKIQKRVYLEDWAARLRPDHALDAVLKCAIQDELQFDDDANEEWRDTLVAAATELKGLVEGAEMLSYSRRGRK